MSDGEAHLPTDADRAALRRWRLVLGRYAAGGLGNPQLTELDGRCDGALDYLYGRELAARGLEPGGGDRHGSLDPSQLTALGWLGEVRDLFPASVCETIQGHALERYGMTDLLKDPAFLASIEPSAQLLGALLSMKGRADQAIQAKIRDLARRVVEDIMRRLRPKVESALSGTRNRFASSPMKSMRNFDWRGTIRQNLKNYDAERGIIVAEHLRFFSRQKRRFPWTIVLCVDQSGSMTASLIYAAVMAAIIAGLPSLNLKLVVFDTSIVDLTDKASDPVEVLLSVQLGGGTDIGRAVTYCEGLITQPSRTILVLVSDFYEGGSAQRLTAAVRRLAEARVTLLGLAALDDRAKPDFDRAMAQRLADNGMKIAALTPEHFAVWLADAIN
jgi:Mg-chelatase subunit ChlD